MKMFRAAASVSVLALSFGVAHAADLTMEPAPVVAPVAEAFNWTGFYVGVHGGLAAGNFDHTLNIPALAPAPTDIATLGLDSSGGFGGAQVGFNYQFAPNWVVGAEADIAASALEGKASLGLNPYYANLNAEAGSEVDWFGTVRGRLGYAWDNLLLYGTGGFAYGDVKTTLSGDLGGTPFDYSFSDTQTGWTAGAGFEYGITPHITLKAEYLYVDLGSSTIVPDSALGGIANVDVDTTFHTAKAGLNYKF